MDTHAILTPNGSVSIQHRCPRMEEHMRPDPSCHCHPHLPTPCSECYSLLVTSIRIPYQESSPWSTPGEDG